jgi:hypothetical protein
MTSTKRFLLRLSALGAMVFFVPAGCQSLLDIQDPDIVLPGNLNDPSALPTLRAGAIGDFTFAYSGSGAIGSAGGQEGQIMTSGLLADEWVNSETFPDRIQVDARNISISGATMQTIFRGLSRARRAAEFAAAKYRQLSPDTTRESGFVEVQILAGYTYILFAENYCSGVPFSTANPDGTIVYGDPLTTSQMLDTAIARFDAALSTANGLPAGATKDLLVNLASVGKGRALLDEGQFAAAAAAVIAVPTGFVYTVQHSENTTRQNNGVFRANVTAERYSVADLEGGNGIAWRSVADSRTPFQRTPAADVGFDNATPQYDNLRYGDNSTGPKGSVTLATGAEARLIEAEAALQAGDTVGWQAFHDGLRAAPPAYFTAPVGTLTATGQQVLLPPLAALSIAGLTAAQVVDLHFTERARWLWLTSHRLGDMRRLVRQYGRGIETVYPTGPYFKQNFTYGADVNFPVPVDELNNPNFTQCIDRNP